MRRHRALAAKRCFLTVNCNRALNFPGAPSYRKYGFETIVVGDWREAAPLTWTFYLGRRSLDIENYYLNVATHEAGFREVRWHAPRLSPAGLAETPGVLVKLFGLSADKLHRMGEITGCRGALQSQRANSESEADDIRACPVPDGGREQTARSSGVNVRLLQTRVRAARLLRQTHLRRQGVTQAVDFVFKLTEKSQTALLRPRDFADHPAVCNAQIFLPPFGRAEITAG